MPYMVCLMVCDAAIHPALPTRKRKEWLNKLNSETNKCARPEKRCSFCRAGQGLSRKCLGILIRNHAGIFCFPGMIDSNAHNLRSEWFSLPLPGWYDSTNHDSWQHGFVGYKKEVRVAIHPVQCLA